MTRINANRFEGFREVLDEESKGEKKKSTSLSKGKLWRVTGQTASRVKDSVTSVESLNE